MSTVILIGYGVAFTLLGVCIWRHRPLRRPPLAARIAAARQRTGITRAVLDTEPGTNLADLDKCELIWSMPAYQNEHQKGEQA